MSEEVLAELRRSLLEWYDANRRELPWRARPGEVPDPYHVWLSEVMLQQTRVDTVRPYFERWLDRFPTLTALGAARQDEVLKAWEGLGYYSRARNLHRAVREVVENYGGRVPDDPEQFRSLPGVGRYTAGAVLSIAFGREEPVVDGNVRRVFARLLDEPAPSERMLWDLAGRLVGGERPGDLNQSIMELGATVCTPRRPRCGECPIAKSCEARAGGVQEQRPAPRTRRPLPTEEHAVAVVSDGDELLLVRRPEGGRLAGLWEFPGVQLRKGESLNDGAVRAAAEWAGLDIVPDRTIAPVEHVFTHVRVRYQPVLAQLRGRRSLGKDEPVRWVRQDALDAFALPRAQRRIIELLARTAGALLSPDAVSR